jgi:hypothetical protein
MRLHYLTGDLMRVRTLWSVVAVVALLLVSMLVPFLGSAQMGSNTMGPNSAMPANDGFSSMLNGTMQQLNESQMTQMMMGLKDSLFGSFSLTGGVVSGKFISFEANPAAGVLSNYSLMSDGNTSKVFDTLSIVGFNDATWQVNGPLFVGTKDDVGVAIHDNPTGTIHVVNGGNSSVDVNMVMPAGFQAMTIDSTGPGVKAWTVMGNGLIGLLMVYNGSVTTDLPMTASLSVAANQTMSQTSSPSNVNVSLMPEGDCVFRALPVSEAMKLADLVAIHSAIANWEVVSEVRMMTVNNWTLSEITNYDMMMTQVVSATPEKIQISVSPITMGGMMNTSERNQTSANVSGGKLAIMTFDRNTLNPDNGTWQVMTDGMQMNQTTSLLDLLNATGSSNMYFVFKTPVSTTFVVSLPTSGSANISIANVSGSTGTFTTTSLAGVSVVAGVATLALVAVVIAMLLLRRKH